MSQSVENVGGEVMTVDEVARFLRVSRSTVVRMLHDGSSSLPFFRVGASVRLFRVEVFRWASEGGTPKREVLRPTPVIDKIDWRR